MDTDPVDADNLWIARPLRYDRIWNAKLPTIGQEPLVASTKDSDKEQWHYNTPERITNIRKDAGTASPFFYYRYYYIHRECNDADSRDWNNIIRNTSAFQSFYIRSPATCLTTPRPFTTQHCKPFPAPSQVHASDTRYRELSPSASQRVTDLGQSGFSARARGTFSQHDPPLVRESNR